MRQLPNLLKNSGKISSCFLHCSPYTLLSKTGASAPVLPALIFLSLYAKLEQRNKTNMKKKPLKSIKFLLFFYLFVFLFISTQVSALEPTIVPNDFDQTVEEIFNTPETEHLPPLGVAENNQKVKEQKEKNSTITIICLVAIFLSGIGVILIFLHPFLHHKKKEILPKF